MKLYFKNLILTIWYILFNEDYRLLKTSCCFDPIYYRKMNPEVVSAGINPLIHYLRCGWQEGIKPNRLFDPCSYTKENPVVKFSRIDPLTHFLQKRNDESIPPYFDATFYRKKYADVATSGIHPLGHYLSIGMAERRQASLFFDVEWYLDRTPVLLKKNMEPFSHYHDYGISEGKSPSPLFDPSYYKSTYKVSESCDLFVHYMTYGVPADHRPCSWFDPVFYRSSYLAAEENTVIPLAHYLEKGVNKGFYPNRTINDLPKKPKISIIVPVYNVLPSFLNNCIRSVLYQSYPHWELCLADDCSSNVDIKPLLERWAALDKRIKVVFLDENKGISGATNVATDLASGDYLGFLDNDDELANDCLFRVVQQINTKKADLYYSDEDLIGEDGRQFDVFNKPGFNRELLLSHNYITHFVVTEKTLYDKVGGFDSTLDGAQDFDLVLKLSDQARKIVHIPNILYHWRASETSTSINHDQKQYANKAGRKAVENALGRCDIDAAVEHLEWKFYYRVKRKLAAFPMVSVCILYRENDLFQENLTRLISSTVYPAVEFILIKGDVQEVFLSDVHTFEGRRNVTMLPTSGNNMPAALYNEAVSQCRGNYIIFLNSFVQFQQKDWIQAMLEYGQDGNVGMVGGRILPVAGEEEFVGILPDMDKDSSLYYARFLQESSRHMVGRQWAQNVFSLSWNLAMIKREYFLELGGFDEKSFGNLFADSDLCFRIREEGKEILYTPFALGRYLEAEEQQSGFDQDALTSEKLRFQKQWRKLLTRGDPYYNLNLLEQNGVEGKKFLTWYRGESGE